MAGLYIGWLLHLCHLWPLKTARIVARSVIKASFGSVRDGIWIYLPRTKFDLIFQAVRVPRLGQEALSSADRAVIYVAAHLSGAY